jgi:tRNA pseudouridine38-40 synthase
MRTYRLTLEYDGTEFEGWQRQPAGHRTVQGVLEEALARVTGAPVAVTGAGRTDAGVHAEGQAASARFATRLDPVELRRALNAVLPDDLAVVDLGLAPDDFDARRDARGKLYRYSIWNGATRSPLRRARSHAHAAPLDVPAMARAARELLGTHDFASFQAAGSSVKTSERTLHRVEVRGRAGGRIEVEVEGDGFLRHMVRTLVGTLLEVGSGRRAAESLPGLLAARSRSAAGPTAPAQGLTLVRVDFGPALGFPRDSGALGPGRLDGREPLG